MRRLFNILCCLICLILVGILIISYHTHKTLYLNIDRYKNSNCVEVFGEINLKDYPNTKIITDKIAIKKIVDYLNSIPLESVYGYFDKSRSEFIIPELLKTQEYASTKKGGLVFYNDDGIEMGRITIYNEKYIEGLNYHAYRVKDKETLIVSGLETLNLN